MFYVLRCFLLGKRQNSLLFLAEELCRNRILKIPKLSTKSTYVNRKWLDSHERLGRKKDFLVSVTKDWEVIKNDEKALAEYLIEKDQHDNDVYRQRFFQPPPVSSLSKPGNLLMLSKPAKPQVMPTSITLSVDNVPNSFCENYLNSHALAMVKSFLLTFDFMTTMRSSRTTSRVIFLL